MLLHGCTSTPLLNLLCINLRFFSQGVQEYVCVSLLELTVPDMILKKAKACRTTIINLISRKGVSEKIGISTDSPSAGSIGAEMPSRRLG